MLFEPERLTSMSSRWLGGEFGGGTLMTVLTLAGLPMSAHTVLLSTLVRPLSTRMPSPAISPASRMSFPSIVRSSRPAPAARQAPAFGPGQQEAFAVMP